MKGEFGYSPHSARSAISAVSLAFLLLLPGAAAQTPPPSHPISDDILRHVRYLASDELTGRGVDTPGIELARDYIAREFKGYGLVPGGEEKGGYFQGFDVVTGVKTQEPSVVRLGSAPPLTLNDGWLPLGLSRSGIAEGEVAFVGYGITAKDYGYDDYAGVDVKGKIALVLRYEPPPKSEQSPFQKPPRSSRHAALRVKAATAREHGALGMILVDLHPERAGKKELISPTRTLGSDEVEIVAVQVRHEMIERWLQEKGFSLRDLRERIDREERPASMPLPGLKASLALTLEKITRKTENVIGILPGSDPELKNEFVVIGAHYDHLGLGHFGTLDTSAEGQIHNGADDNASGTAVLLSLARRLSQLPNRHPRTIIFTAFSGEELGVYGSRHYVTHPPFPLPSTRAMINLDMVGRMRDNRMTVFGVDTAREFRTWVQEVAQKIGIELRLIPGGIGRSDHVPFHHKGIPVLHFFTGIHEDYHRPTDDLERLNLEGMIKVSDLVFMTVEKIASAREPMTFVPLKPAPARPQPIPTSPLPAQDP